MAGPDFTIQVKTAGMPTGAMLTVGLAHGMGKVADAIVRRATQNLSGRFVRVGTGKLRRSLKTSVSIRGTAVVARVRSGVYYGQILETGAAPHVIEPKSGGTRRRVGRRQGKRVLAFVPGASGSVNTGGATVFAGKVHHPGTRPRPWMRGALQETVPEIGATIEAEITAAFAAAAASEAKTASAFGVSGPAGG